MAMTHNWQNARQVVFHVTMCLLTSVSGGPGDCAHVLLALVWALTALTDLVTG